MQANLSRLALVAALGIATIGTTHAQVGASDNDIYQWVSQLAATRSEPSANQQAPFGYAATKNADREITLSSESHYLNVTRLETIKINFGGKSIVWTFDTLGTSPFPLSKILPEADGITVYVKENPAYSG